MAGVIINLIWAAVVLSLAGLVAFTILRVSRNEANGKRDRAMYEAIGNEVRYGGGRLKDSDRRLLNDVREVLSARTADLMAQRDAQLEVQQFDDSHVVTPGYTYDR